MVFVLLQEYSNHSPGSSTVFVRLPLHPVVKFDHVVGTVDGSVTDPEQSQARVSVRVIVFKFSIPSFITLILNTAISHEFTV